MPFVHPLQEVDRTCETPTLPTGSIVPNESWTWVLGIFAGLPKMAKETTERIQNRTKAKQHRLYLAVHWGGEFRIPNCHEMVLELVCGADFWCNRLCRTSPVVLEGLWGPSLAENRPKTGKNQNSELPVNRYEFPRSTPKTKISQQHVHRRRGADACQLGRATSLFK